jgi:hypothetical protein
MSISIDKEKKKEKERIAVNQLSMKSRKRMLLAALFTTTIYSFNHLKPKLVGEELFIVEAHI